MALNLSTLTDSSTSAGILTDLAKSASNLELVASLENRVSGGPNATQTIASEQSRAHVPVGGGHLYIPNVSGNYAEGPSVTIGANETWQGELDMVITSFGNYIRPMGGVTGGWNSGFGLIFYSSGSVRCFSGNIATDGVPSGVTLGTQFNVKYGYDGSELYVNINDTSIATKAATFPAINETLQLAQQNSLTAEGEFSIQKAKLTVGSSVVFDCDFSASNIGQGDTSFQAAVGGTVTINTSGTDPATIVRKSFMRMDIVDDEYEFTTDSAVNGTIVVGTLEGTYSANISLDASTQYDLQARGVAATPQYGFLKNVIGYLITPSQLSDSEITSIEAYFVDQGAAARSAFGSVTNFQNAWRDCTSLTSFPLIITSSGTTFGDAWRECTSLTSFPLIDTSSGTNLARAWYNCNSITSFPAIDTSSATSFDSTWQNCSSLTSFPTLNASSVTNFYGAWRDCNSLTSFPALDTSSGTSFRYAWYNCTSLTSFPLIDTSSGTSFDVAWTNCNSLTSFPLINTSLGTNFSSAWQNCTSLTSFPEIDTSSGTNFRYAWYNCTSLTSFPEIDTSSGTTFYRAWRDCTSLTSFPAINTSSGTNFNQAWYDCTSLTSFPEIDTSSGTSFNQTWYNCTSLTSFPAIDTSSGTNFFLAWRNCNSLTSFPLLDTSSGTDFGYAWYDCTSLTSFPLINTSSGTAFQNAWYDCTSLTSFPLLNTSSGTAFNNAWRNCNSLTSFPLINTSSGTNFSSAWYDCTSLTSFPAINTSSGTNFFAAWYNCTSLTSFPAIDTSSGTDFAYAWYSCNSLTTFPANFFDSWSPASVTDGVFNLTWDGCSSLTAQSVENILTSIDTSGVYGTDTGASGGTQLSDNTIDIDYDGTTLSSATSTAITSLKSKNWAISINSVIQ
jgi:hypothetical protein